VQPILVDRGQLFLERLVEKLDDLGIALHARLPNGEALLPRGKFWKHKTGGKLPKTCD
jgi:hypothetical protein